MAKQSALGQSATAAAILTVGGRVTWQSALGQSAPAAAILTVGGRVMAALIAALLATLVAQSALGQSATGDALLTVDGRIGAAATEPHAQGEKRLLSALARHGRAAERYVHRMAKASVRLR